MQEELSMTMQGLLDTVALAIALAAVTLLVLETLYITVFTVFMIHKRSERGRS